MPTPEEVLNLPMGPNDAGASTVRGYLVELLLKVWREGDDFSGKRPFGNSAWYFEVYKPLILAGFVEGVVDEFNGVVDVESHKADDLISLAILSMHPDSSRHQ